MVASGLLTNAVTDFGHAIVSGIFRFDVNLLAAAPKEGGGSTALFAWGRLAIANVERLIAWLFIWPAAHFIMVLVGVVLGLKRLPVPVVVPVEFIPGSMLAWSFPRAYYTFRRVRKVSEALDSAQKTGNAVPSWATEPGWRYRLVEGSDWEIAVVVALAILFAWSLTGH